MGFLKLILELIIYKWKLSLSSKFAYFFIYTTVLLYRNISHIFKGGSQLAPQIKNSVFAERRKLHVENSIITNTNFRTHRQNLVSLEEVDKINFKYEIVKKLLKYSLLLDSDFFIKKSESNNSFKFRNNLTLCSFIIEKIKVIYSQGGKFFIISQLLKDLFIDLIRIINNEFLRHTLYYLIKYKGYRNSSSNETRFSVLYKQSAAEYFRSKVTMQKNYVQTFSNLNTFVFFKVFINYVGIIFYLINFCGILIKAFLSKIFSEKIFDVIIIGKSLKFKSLLHKLKLKVSFLILKSFTLFKPNLKKIRAFKLFRKLQFYFFLNKIEVFIKRRTKAKAQLITIGLTLTKDIKTKILRAAYISFWIRRGIYALRFSNRLKIKENESSLLKNLNFLNSILKHSKLKYNNVNKSDFNKLYFLKRKLIEGTFSLKNKKNRSNSFCLSEKESSFQDFSISRLKNIKKLQRLKFYKDFFSKQKLGADLSNFPSIKNEIFTQMLSSKINKIFIKKAVKINFYSFFNKSDKILNYYKKLVSLTKNKKNIGVFQKKSYLEFLFFLKYFIIKRERIWGAATYLMSGAQQTIKKTNLIFEENFLICYRFIQKYNSGLFFDDVAKENKTAFELKNFLIAADIFELQDFVYRSFLRNNVIFFFLINLPLCFYIIPEIFNLNIIFSILISVISSFLITAVYIFITINFYRNLFFDFKESLIRFYKFPKSYGNIELLIASFLNSIGEFLIFFRQSHFFDLIIYIRLKKFILTSFPIRRQNNLTEELLKQSFLIFAVLSIYVLVFYKISGFFIFDFSDKLLLYFLVVKVYTILFIFIVRFFKFFLTFKFVKEKTSIWSYFIFFNYPVDKFYRFFDHLLNLFFQKFYLKKKDISLVDFILPVKELELSQKDIAFLKEILKVEVNLETNSLKKIIVISERKKEKNFKKL